MNEVNILFSQSDVAEERKMQSSEQKCLKSTSLVTTYVSDTQAYGIMFNVRSKRESILIETLEFSSVFLEGGNDIHVLVFTKEGGYEGFQADPGAWVLIADTQLTPATGGRGTLIPARKFAPVQLGPHSEQAFYITLETSALRYSHAPSGSKVGSVFIQDEFLQVRVGAGLLEYPFSSRIFEPRVFCGTFHYKRMVDCEIARTLDSKMSYAFVVQHDHLTDNVVIAQINTVVHDSVVALLGSDLELTEYKASADLDLIDVTTTISPGYNPQGYAECLANTIRTCTQLVSEISFRHSDKLNRGDLEYIMLRYRTQVTSNLNLGKSMDVVYNGRVPMQADLLIRLDGIQSGETMNMQQTSYLEDETQAFLNTKLANEPAVEILDVKMKGLPSMPRRYLMVGDRILAKEKVLAKPYVSMDVSTLITASVAPSKYVDLVIKIEDLIDLQGAELVENVRRHSDIKLGIQDGTFFEKVNTVSATPLNGTDRNGVISNERNGIAGWVIFLTILVVLVVGGVVGFFSWRRHDRRKYEKEDDMYHSNMEETEQEEDQDQSTVFSAYENAFHGIVDNRSAAMNFAKSASFRKTASGRFTSVRSLSGGASRSARRLLDTHPVASSGGNEQDEEESVLLSTFENAFKGFVDDKEAAMLQSNDNTSSRFSTMKTMFASQTKSARHLMDGQSGVRQDISDPSLTFDIASPVNSNSQVNLMAKDFPRPQMTHDEVSDQIHSTRSFLNIQSPGSPRENMTPSPRIHTAQAGSDEERYSMQYADMRQPSDLPVNRSFRSSFTPTSAFSALLASRNLWGDTADDTGDIGMNAPPIQPEGQSELRLRQHHENVDSSEHTHRRSNIIENSSHSTETDGSVSEENSAGGFIA